MRAFFVEHASAVVFERTRAAFAGAPMEGNAFGECVHLGDGTAGIVPPRLDACVPPQR